MKKIILLLLLAMSNAASAQTNSDTLLVNSFAQDVCTSKKSFHVIVQSYFCDLNKVATEVSLLQLKDLRDRFGSSKIRIQSYAQVPAEERTLELQSSEHVYRILANGKHACFVLVKGDKIVSVATMNKGGYRILY
jgi:hypothetical protein